MVKSLSAMWETQVQSLDWEEGNNNLEKKIITHSSILAWRIPWTEEPGGLQFMGLQSQAALQPHSYLLLSVCVFPFLLYFTCFPRSLSPLSFLPSFFTSLLFLSHLIAA